MNKIKRLIFKVNNLEKNYDSQKVLNVKKIDIHPGTIYGIVGAVGSGKSTLLNILAGTDKQSSGILLYEGQSYKKNWLGKIQSKSDIYYAKSSLLRKYNQTVANYVSDKYANKKKIIKNRYFDNTTYQNLWTRKINNISIGELHWIAMILACEADPRVLLIDDYAIYFNAKMEKDFRMKINNMNRTLGTTIILSSPTDMYLKYFASVLIFLDHGHIYKIRPGVVSNKKTVANRKTKSKNYRPRKRNRNHKKK
tara:strand:+ start:108 stop:863 length:756 start_codon:yes stop_codon:yes gene_type:complete